MSLPLANGLQFPQSFHRSSDDSRRRATLETAPTTSRAPYRWLSRWSDREFEASQIRRYTPRYQWFAGAAVILLLLEALILDRRGDFQDAVPKPETLA